MRPLNLDKLKYRASNGGFYNKSVVYRHIDTVNEYSMAWSSGETPGEYKYKIYYYEGDQTWKDGSNAGVQYSFVGGTNKDSIYLMSTGKYYTRGEYAKFIDDTLQNIVRYNFNFTLKYVGWQIKKDDVHQDKSDIYGFYEKRGTQTTGLNFDGESTITSNYSEHHFSIIVTNGSNQVGGVPYVYPDKNDHIIASIHDSLQGRFSPLTQIEHEFLHSLHFGHTLDYSEMIYNTYLNSYAPSWEGIILKNHDAKTQLGLDEDGIHGLDTIYNVQNNSHLKIVGSVYESTLLEAEDARDDNGNRLNKPSGYLGYGHAFLVELLSGEIYYQSPIDSKGYFEFRIRVPNRYIRTLENIQFYIFVVSSHFTKNFRNVVRPKYYNGPSDKGVPIFWGKSVLQDLSGISLPYTLDLTSQKISMARNVLPTQIEKRGKENDYTFYSDVFDVLKKESGVVVTYRPYVKGGITKQPEIKKIECGVK